LIGANVVNKTLVVLKMKNKINEIRLQQVREAEARELESRSGETYNPGNRKAHAFFQHFVYL
jgi:hypothetical protein